MLVTQTWREIVTLLPRFRIMAMSMERLQIRQARISAVSIDVIHLDPVVMLKEQLTVVTAPTLPFQRFPEIA
jgi:hypothetical protein